jgi:uncharacterized protein YcgI (DUF1989 family)
MAKPQFVPAAQGAGLKLKRGEQLRVIDPEGGQTGDLVAFSQDGRQRHQNPAPVIRLSCARRWTS